MSSNKKKILVIAFETRDLYSYPSIINSIRLLIDNDYEVDVHIPDIMKTSFTLPGVRLYYFSNDSLRFILSSFKKAKKNNYYHIISFYLEGLYSSLLLNFFSVKKTPTIYFSMELFYGDFIKYRKLLFVSLFKSRSVKVSIYYVIFIILWIFLHYYGKKFIILGIVQDENRLLFLKEEFTFIENFILVPNSYIGSSCDTSDFLYNRFDIDKSKKIILFTGGFEKGSDLSLLKLADLLPDDYLLFFNIYSRDNYIDEIKDLFISDKIFYNKNMLNDNEFTELVESSYIGLAWYDGDFKNNPNMYYMGLSSGKLTKYLSCSKPVIATDNLYGYFDLIDKNGLGVTCKNSSEIISAVKTIHDNYDKYQANITAYYNTHIEFNKSFNKVIDFIKK